MAEAVGFTGLAGAAWELASSLARAGQLLVVHDDDAERAESFARAFACRAARDPTELAVLGMVFFAPQAGAANATAARVAAMAPRLRAGAILVDLADSDPSATRELGAALSHRGVVLIDAALCGAAQDPGGLSIVHGCDDESALELALPVLRGMGHPVLAGGALGCGQALRLLQAHVRASALAAAADALLAGERLGVDAASLRARVEVALGQRFEPAAFARAGVPAATLNAGLALGLFAGAQAGEPLPAAHAPGLTRLLIEFTTPVKTKETL